MGVLNFSTDNLITGVNVIDQNLYWTDNNSEPKKLEIDRFRDYDHSGSATSIRGDYVIESDLSVIRLHPWQPIQLELTAYTETTEQPEPPFEQIFPRFSYRWRYEDGQYSPYAPFTQAAFLPATRTPGSGENQTERENYIEGFNTTMFNNVGQIDLNNIPRGPRDVVAVDLLYTESISSTIYVLETIDIPQAQRGLDFLLSSDYVGGEPRVPQDYALLPLSYSLSARKIYSALPGNQLTRPYDEVPQRALAQEVTANRLIYANYQIGFDQPDPLQLTSTFVSAGTGDGLHVKGNRTYEIGVAYIDAYGRQGAMVQAGSIIQDDGSVSEQIPLTSPFHQTTRQQIQATITSDPPPWADRYRYFIKDPAMDHHNLICYNIYNDGDAGANSSDFVWLEFQSTDRNKVFEQDQALDGNTGTVLVLKRSNDTVETTKQRFLVQDIQNEAPDDVRRALTQTASNNTTTSHGTIDNGPYDTDRAFPTTAGSTLLNWESVTGNLSSFQLALDLFNRVVNRNQGNVPQPALNYTEPLPVGLANGITVDLTELETPVYLRFENRSTGATLGGDGRLVQVTQIVGYNGQGDLNIDRLQITLGQHWDLSDEGQITLVDGATGIPAGYPASADPLVEIYTSSASEEAIERLQGRFWVKTARNGLTTTQSSFTFEGELIDLQQFWFETEPAVAESNLDLFWETSDTFCVCTQHGWPNTLNWFNCIAEVGGTTNPGVYLESTRINDRFNTVQLVKGVRVNVPTGRNESIHRMSGLTWSGIYNGRTDVNRLNEFITADGIVKEIEPNYGSIQKLHTRDTNLVVFAEDKVFNILADKDILFNADGGGNVASANAVLGQTTPYVGEYGIGKAPESFSTYGYQAWFADPVRGCIIEFIPSTGGQAQLREISKSGMSDFFRDRLFTSTRIHGMFDEYGDKYVVSMQGYDQNDTIIDPADRLPGEDGNTTISYDLDVQGWPSRMSWVPEGGISLGNKFYSWNNGQIYEHNSNTAARNNFYGTQYNSEVEIIFNDDPSAVKEFLTLNYEGTPDWTVVGIDTESEDTALTSTWPFVSKENKFFTPIVSTENIYGFTDIGMGSAMADDGTTVYIQGTKDKSGIKGFYNNVRLRNEQTTKQELFSIGTENFISSN